MQNIELKIHCAMHEHAHAYEHAGRFQLTIGSYVSVCSLRYEARRKFGEHERCIRVA